MEPPPQPIKVLIVPSLPFSELRQLGREGAVGLLVPGVGPTTNRRQALASLVRGELENARLGGVPNGPVLISTSAADAIPRRRPLIVVSLPPRGRPGLNDRRYPMAVLGYGYHGLLVSPTTRIPGLVSMVDIAPTALGRARGGLTSKPTESAGLAVRRLDRQISANNTLKLPALLVVGLVVALLGVARPRAALSALPVALATNIVLGAAGITNVAVMLVGLAACTAAGGLTLARVLKSELLLLALFVLLLLGCAATMAFEPEWFAVAPLGPTQNSRFYGVGNQIETLLLAPVLAGAVLAARRFGVVGYIGFALLALVTVADNNFGSDGGGAVVLGVGFAVLGARLARLRARGVAVSLLASAAVVGALVRYDLHQSRPDHLRSAFSGGIGGLLAVARNRIPLAYEPAFDQWYLVGPAALGFAIATFAVLRTARSRLQRDLVLVAVVSVLTSLIVNDSAAYVLIGGIAVLAAAGRPMLPEPGARRVAFARVPLGRPATEVVGPASTLGPLRHADPEKL
ncbi:MAG: hypothetical protein ABR569_06165 [Gaiellaceae bacterium]